MKTQLLLFRVRTFCCAALVTGSSFSWVAEFSDANWMSMGGIPGANGPVYAAVVDDLGNVYIGGNFTIVGDVFATNIAKWNGTNWSSLSLGVNSAVYALAVLGSDLYAGGNFITAGGGPANYIAKWNGSSWSALGSGLGGDSARVSALVVSGSDLYAGGNFETAGGKVSAYIARAALPALSVFRSDTNVTASWRSADTADFVLEQAGALAAPTNWVTTSAIVTDDGINKSVTLPATNSAQFLRLRRP